MSMVLDLFFDVHMQNETEWRRTCYPQQLGANCKMGGESLQRPPRGYDTNHPLIQDIKRKDFTIGRSLRDNEVTRGNFLEATLDVFRETAPFVAFLSEAVGLP